jgi:hypothetical protein
MNHDELVTYLDQMNEFLRLAGACSGVHLSYEPNWLKIAVGSERVQHELTPTEDLSQVRSMLAAELHDQVAKSLERQKANVRDSLVRERKYQSDSADKVKYYERVARDVVRATKKFKRIQKPLIPGAPKKSK